MKKLLALFLPICLLFTLLLAGGALAVSACDESYEEFDDGDLEEEDATYWEGDYQYTVVNKEAIIIDYWGNEKRVEIPASLGGFPVVALSGYDDYGDWNSVFRYCDDIISITIPKTVTQIDRWTFESCSDLKKIIVEKGNPRYYDIDGVLFDNNNKELVRYPSAKEGYSYAIPEGIVEINSNAFAGCQITQLTIPPSVLNIGVFAFDSCNQLKSVYISDLTAWCNLSINYGWAEAGAMGVSYGGNPLNTGADLYLNGKLLTNLVIPEGVTRINKALSFGRYITSVSIPSTLKSITGRSLNSPVLSTITVAKNNPNFCAVDGVLYSKDLTSLVRYPRAKEGAFSIPSTVTSIGVYALSNCNGLTAITLDKNTDYICDYAFWGCDNLETVYYNGTKEQRGAIEYSTEDPDDYEDTDCGKEQGPFLQATWHYNCKFASITTQPKSVSAKANQVASVSVKASGDGLTYAWYVSDVQDSGKYYLSPSKKTNTYSITLTPDRVGRKAYCIVTDKYGNAVKTNTVTLNVAKTPVSDLKVTLSKTSYTYNGKVQKPSVTVKDSKGNVLKKNTDYTVSYPAGCLNVDSYKVTVKMKGNYTGTVTKTFKINPISVSKCKISLSSASYTYNGSVKRPAVTVKNHNGTKLSTANYTVTYASGRKNVGTYKVTIKMKGNYTGTVTKAFKINPAKTSVKSLTAGKKSLKVAITKKIAQVSGYQIQYSTSKKFSSYKTKTLTSYKKTSLTLSGLSVKKTYYVRVRTYKTVNGVKYYSGWSTIKYKKTK